MKRITMLLGAGILLLCSTLFAAVPQLINFQGILKDGSGNPVANGPYFVTFRIYAAPIGGNPLWSDTQTVVTASGLFNVILGDGWPIHDSVFADTVQYIGVQVFPDPEMTPRQRMTSVGFAYRVNTVNGAAGGNINGSITMQAAAQPIAGVSLVGPAGINQMMSRTDITPDAVLQNLRPVTSAGGWLRFNHEGINDHWSFGMEPNDRNLYFKGGDEASTDYKATFDTAGRVGIGTTTPVEKLEVNGALKFTGDANVISRAPRVIRTNDVRGGCPPAAPANVDFLTQNFTLARPGMVFITADMVRSANGRADLELRVDGATVQYTIAHTPVLEWQGASVHWAGTLGAGAHTVSLRSPQANIWGCGANWGGINTIIFE